MWYIGQHSSRPFTIDREATFSELDRLIKICFSAKIFKNSNSLKTGKNFFFFPLAKYLVWFVSLCMKLSHKNILKMRKKQPSIWPLLFCLRQPRPLKYIF